jgi:uncharacterized small protein (DUF1192 family)
MELEERIAILSKRLADLEIEVQEQWIINSELNEELATLRAEINHPGTT